tara:strand:+ start:89 stop:295 length:207 start_codon:yes stop_codon:yes gene_type:complete
VQLWKLKCRFAKILLSNFVENSLWSPLYLKGKENIGLNQSKETTTNLKCLMPILVLKSRHGVEGANVS